MIRSSNRTRPTSRAQARRTIACGLALAAFTSLPLQAAPTAAPVRAEIDAVLQRLAVSGCRFNRNGDWHDGAEARAHLLRKLKGIEDKGTVVSTEQFIDLAASRSSVSGQSYQVQCPGSPATPSVSWLSAQLREVRRSAPAAR